MTTTKTPRSVHDLPVYAFVDGLPVSMEHVDGHVVIEAWDSDRRKMTLAPEYLRVIAFGRDDDGEYPEIEYVSKSAFKRKLAGFS